MRKQAHKIISSFSADLRSSVIVHGSLARGDVDDQSDIDTLVQHDLSTQIIENRLEAAGYRVYEREIAQATPMHTPKAHIYLDPEHKTAVTIPLLPLRRLEYEFYRFGGSIGPKEIDSETRVIGCTKRLTLIQPTQTGHSESSIIGKEALTAKFLGVSLGIVQERVRVLSRRDKIGRTGVFLRVPVEEDLSFEEALSHEARENPALRRTLRQRDR